MNALGELVGWVLTVVLGKACKIDLQQAQWVVIWAFVIVFGGVGLALTLVYS